MVATDRRFALRHFRTVYKFVASITNTQTVDTDMKLQKTITTKIAGALAVLFLAGAVSACSPKVGSEEWCNDLKEKPKGDWTANEATDFAKHCLM